MKANCWCGDMVELFGRLTVIETRSYHEVVCRCICGKIVTVSKQRLRNGQTRSCGCLRSDVLKKKWAKHPSRNQPPVGSIFGRLTVRRVLRQRLYCECICGEEKWVSKYDVLYGKTTSCGCFNKEISAEKLRKAAFKHGGWGTKEWGRWHGMICRCYDPKEIGYARYGGRGITVCERWLGDDGFANFRQDLGPVPPGHTLDRIDPDGNYTPTNVRWATVKQQARNRRSNRLITAFGKTQCIAAWSDETGIKRHTIGYRIRHGWTSENALMQKPGSVNRWTKQ